MSTTQELRELPTQYEHGQVERAIYERWIEAVQVDCQEDIAPAHKLGQWRKVPADMDILGKADPQPIALAANQVDLFTADRANAKLGDGRAQVEDTLGHAGVAVRTAFVALAQVAMGVDLHQHEVAVDGVDGLGDTG